MGEQFTVAHVERLIVDEQPDQLAIGHVDYLPPRLRQAIGALGIRQRPRLIDPVQIAARQAVRLRLNRFRPRL
jgi:hypothetical protein